MKKLIAFPLALALLAGAVGVAGADAKYTKKTTYHQQGTEGMGGTVTVYLKGKRERTDSVYQMGPIKTENYSMVWCDKEQDILFDPELKIFSSRAISPKGAPATPTPGQPAPAKASGTGTSTITYTVKDLGWEQVGKIKAHHYKITMSYTMEGCVGSGTYAFEREVWIGPELPRLVCPRREGSSDYTANGCKVKVVQKGDYKLYLETLKGEAVKEIIYQDGKPTLTTELIDYSSAPLGDDVFNLPGYTKVEEADFQAQLQQKMMKKFQNQNQ